jgi:hypothetical protein
LLEDLHLHRLVLGRGFDDKVALAERAIIRRAGDAVQRGLLIGGGQLLLLYQPIEARRHGVAPARDRGLVDVDHRDRKPNDSARLRDAATHGAGADNADRLQRCHCFTIRSFILVLLSPWAVRAVSDLFKP